MEIPYLSEEEQKKALEELLEQAKRMKACRPTGHRSPEGKSYAQVEQEVVKLREAYSMWKCTYCGDRYQSAASEEALERFRKLMDIEFTI